MVESDRNMQGELAAKKMTRRQKVNVLAGLSDKQRELLETLLLPEIRTIKQAAEQLGWKPNDAYQMLLRIKLGDAKASGYHQEVSYYKVKLAKQGKRFLEEARY